MLISRKGLKEGLTFDLLTILAFPLAEAAEARARVDDFAVESLLMTLFNLDLVPSGRGRSEAQLFMKPLTDLSNDLSVRL